ncbi:hypothetical protein [Zooshikella sp. RANM57]|uniref:hypothetical protein n=1 Tax=Zooshikella sp. RANM57 TaxID=3425863 RepID=UPI003D6DAA0C
MMNKHRVKFIRGASSESFPLVGSTGAKYHTPGQRLEPDPIAHAKRIATVDGLMVSTVFTDRLHRALTHFDVLAPYTKECAEALSDAVDKNILRMACKASFITNEAQCKDVGLTPVKGETFTNNIQLNKKDDEFKAIELYNALLKARTEFKNKKVRGRPYVILRPDQYAALLTDTDVGKLVTMHKDVGGQGSVAEGTIGRLAGFDIYESINLPDEDESAGLIDTPEFPDRADAYRGDYSKVVGLIMMPDAVCTLKAMDITTESKYMMEYQGDFIVAKYAMGHNILRPACAISILKKTTATTR